MIVDEKLVESYERMFDMPGWRAFMDGLQEQYKVLCDISTIAPGETLEVRQAKLGVLTRVMSFETAVVQAIAESLRD